MPSILVGTTRYRAYGSVPDQVAFSGRTRAYSKYAISLMRPAYLIRRQEPSPFSRTATGSAPAKTRALGRSFSKSQPSRTCRILPRWRNCRDQPDKDEGRTDHFRCSALNRSASSRGIPPPSIARVAIMNASFGRLSWISFTIIQVVEFLKTVKGRNGAPWPRLCLREC
jgi:hypothetical protein